MRPCIRRNCGIIFDTISAIAATSTVTLTTISQDSPRSSRSAMMMPPTHMIGAVTINVQVSRTSICTCCTSLVVRVISDGAPKCVISRAENEPDPVEDRGAGVAAEAHGRPGSEVDRGDRADDLHAGHREHQGADAQDVARVALGHAVVDDVGVEARQVERGQRAEQLEHDHGEQGPGVRPQAGPEQGDQHGCPPGVRGFRSVIPWSRTSAMRSAASGWLSEMAGWVAAKVSSRMSVAVSSGE